MDKSTTGSWSIGNATSTPGELAHPGDLGQVVVRQRELEVQRQHAVDERVVPAWHSHT